MSLVKNAAMNAKLKFQGIKYFPPDEVLDNAENICEVK